MFSSFLVHVLVYPPAYLVTYLFFWPFVKGYKNFPRRGPVILISNHVSWFDPAILHCVLHRNICFMAKKEMFESKFSAWFWKSLGAFPVDRDNPDINAVKKALNFLKLGRTFGVFPEGTRATDEDHMLEFRKGAALIALKSSVPVVPVFIKYRKTFGLSHIYIGKPLYIKEYTDGLHLVKTEALEKGTQYITSAMNELKDDIAKNANKS